MNTLLKRFAAAGLLGVLVLALLAWRSLTSPVEVPEESRVVEVVQGSGANQIAARLAAEGLLSNPRLWAWYARATGQAEQLRAGEYEFADGITPTDILAQLVAGKVKLHTFTILEGWTVREVLQALDSQPAISRTLADNITAESLSDALQLPYEHAEGLFYPETYNFPKGTTDTALLKQAAELMSTELVQAWTEHEDAHGDASILRSPYELLILASIVERETAVDEERPEIAGVFLRRLNKRMRLQTDPTVIYGMGDAFDGDIRRRDLKTDTPYNTYTRYGLPPTPIGMPSRSSMSAVANADPDVGTSLYFVAVGDGSGRHVFNDTLQGHNLAVAEYLKRLRSQRNSDTK